MYFVLLILVILFLATIGIQLVLKTSLFVANFDSKDSQENEIDTNSVLLAPEIINIPEATNSAKIAIEGTGTSGSIISFYVNDDKQDVIDNADTSFATTIKLALGKNTVYVTSEDPNSGEEKSSRKYSVLYSIDKPYLEITSHKDNDVVEDDNITIQGKTDAGSLVHVNGSPTVVQADGSFSKSIRLTEGDNTITIESANKASNAEVIELHLKYERS